MRVFLLSVVFLSVLFLDSLPAWGQDLTFRAPRDTCPKVADSTLDRLYIEQIEIAKGRPKVLHAEPLFIDLIRDLGARKGEREWNIGTGITDNFGYDRHDALIEYEFAPIDRLGLEIETPFEFYTRHPGYRSDTTILINRLKSLKLAGQYTFLVSQKHATSWAIGYIHEFQMPDQARESSTQLLDGHLYNPFFVGAKRWGDNWHTLIYAGPAWTQHLSHSTGTGHWSRANMANLNVHYMIPGTRNFLGIETNIHQELEKTSVSLRPQMRVGLADNLLVGIVAGIPVDRNQERMSVFTRLIWEPGHKHR
jgi:hypothetical protein